VAPGAGSLDSSDTLGGPFGDEADEAPAFEKLTRDSTSAPDAAASAQAEAMMPAVNHG
jgi:hypothetical protein